MTGRVRAAVDVLRLFAAPVVFLGVWGLLLADAVVVMRGWDVLPRDAYNPLLGLPLMGSFFACGYIAYRVAAWVAVGPKRKGG